MRKEKYTERVYRSYTAEIAKNKKHQMHSQHSPACFPPSAYYKAEQKQSLKWSAYTVLLTFEKSNERDTIMGPFLFCQVWKLPDRFLRFSLERSQYNILQNMPLKLQILWFLLRSKNQKNVTR